MWNKGVKIVICAFTSSAILLAGCGGEVEVNRHPEEYVYIEPEEDAYTPLETEGKSKAQYQDKEETVEAEADAGGKVKEITVSTRLSGVGEGDLVSDATCLSEIKNKNGDERYALSEDGTLLWENLGEDIVYEGKTEKELPVEVRVSYFLDEKETDPMDMIGKSGHVKLRFDYVNNEKRSIRVGDRNFPVYLRFCRLV